RKLYQYAQERKEMERDARRQRDLEDKRAESGAMHFEQTAPAFQQPVTPIHQPEIIQIPEVIATITPAPTPVPTPAPTPVPASEAPKPDELTEKLKKLRMLFENGLISQEEYNQKKLDLLSDL
ncbi:MAG: SHOCT domain-containing protein, partial [Bacteroidota bacterium]